MKTKIPADRQGTVKRSRKKKFKQKFFLWLGSNFGGLFLRVLKKTIRFTILGDEHFQKHFIENRKVIFALWHGNMFIPILHHIDKGVYALVSQHRDGEIIARVFTSLGFQNVRGSSTRGGSEAMKEMVRIMKEGAGIAITPDGPKGPYRELKLGTVKLAQRSGAPVIPIGSSADRAKYFGSWDRFMVVKPFSKAVMIYGEPISIPRDLSEEELEEHRKLVEDKIKQSNELAENYFRK
ncbi:MAG: lysophospholipid acyltransferase family protein [bacterium]|nr:lysophospholipid acyltransferase family protein [bacterium]